MKKYLHTVLAAGFILLMLASCKKDETKIVVDPATSKAGTLSATATAITLTKATLTNTAVTFTSTDPNFGYSAAVTTTLQISPKGNNFATKKEFVFSGKNVSTSFTVADFNNLLLALNLTTGTSAQVEARMVYSISSNVTPIYSNVLTLTATPFALTSYVYVPGGYQGWLPPSADSLKSATGNGIYTGIINFTGNDLGFKITPAKSWATSYGDAGSGKISLSANGNITAPAAGQYLVTVDLNANTITMVSTNYYSIIGDATAGGWGSDTDMKYDNGNEYWAVKAPLTAGGAFKVRKNHDWGVSYGTIATPDGATLTSSNGGNIPVTVTGNYKFTFVTTGTSTAAYTLTKQ